MTFRTDATASEIREAGAKLVEAYGVFRVARGPLSSLVELEARGRDSQPLPRASVLELGSGPVDVRTLAARRPVWDLDAGGRAVGVVHFHGPIKPEWLGLLEAEGTSILRYIPHHAFVVRGRPADLEAVSLFPFVDWVGSFDPAWKIRPSLAINELVDVRIVVFPGVSPSGIAAWLGHHGVPAGDRGVRGSFGTGNFQWVRARVPSALIRPLAALPGVEFVDPVEPVHPLNAQTAWVIQTNLSGNYRYWLSNLDGRGQVIGMADTGLDYDGDQFTHSAIAITLGDIYNATDVNRRKVVRYVNMGVLTGQLTWPGGGGLWDPFSIKDCVAGHGTGVGSTLAGNDGGIGSSVNDGNALMAQIYFQDVDDCPNEFLTYVPENYEDLFGPPGLVYNDPVAPVRVHSNSWGADTNVYDVQARMVDAFVWAHPDMTILFAAGNCIVAGCPLVGSVGTPATAKNVVTVGGAFNPDAVLSGAQNDLAPASSRGPAIDGRIKPTIVTIFDGDSAMSDGDPLSGTGLPDAHWQGTSYATPAASAAAAIVRQYFVDGWYPAGRPIPGNALNPSSALIRATLIASGAQVTGGGTVSRSSSDTWPNNEQGFGRILLSNVLPIASAGDTFRTQVVDGTAGLLTGDEAAYTFHVAVPGRVKFVLAWNDYPGTLAAAKALVNDLDLEVTAPDGTVYRGNHFGPFAQGQSLAGGTVDTTNVEEAVILRNAMAGDWSVRVIASDVPVGPQPFALVATGNLDGSFGRVSLDRFAYTEADTIQVTVDDADAAFVVVRVTSDIEPAGEEITLTRAATDEQWRGAITTTFGGASADGVLQVQDGDFVRAVYQDASPPHLATAEARILASGPTIHDVRATDIGALSATIRWSTTESALGEVRYGTSPISLPFDASAPNLRLDHAIPLTDLTPDTTYYFEVISRGRLGNATIDTDGGRSYVFRTASLGDVLLVIGGSSFPPEREASYAAALDGTGWTWSLWRVAELGLPPLSVLQARRAVIWQVGLEQYPPFDASARALVQGYLDGGGRLLVSSHDTAWALSSPDSTVASPESAAWVRGVLKAAFDCDPLTITTVDGVSADPISGAYTTGVPYTPHRDGGASDEFMTNAAGGTPSVVWTDDGGVQECSPQNRPTGLRWISSAANGTVGTGAWGGHASRLVYFAFEITGLDSTKTDLKPGSPTRAAILDAALRWLVSDSATTDRDHPDIRITSPNGGSFAGPSITVDWTASAHGSGIGIAGFTLASSADAGQTWTTIAALPAAARTYSWDIGTTPNGDRYLLHIQTQDDGTPSLSAEDTTDATFAIQRPGGDAEGPVLWPGSVRLRPRPPGTGFPATFTATSDDRTRGAGTIASAELFLQTSEPVAGDSGTGLPMVAVDGSFGDAVENVSHQGELAAAPGDVLCGWVHARDAAGNWGAFGSICFTVIFRTNQPPSVSIRSPVEGQALQAGSDVMFTWTMSDDMSVTANLRVWANITIDNQTTPLVVDSPGTTSVVWTAPDLDAQGVVFHLDVLDELGLRSSIDRAFSLTRSSQQPPVPSALGLVIAVLIALVLLTFLVFGFFRARREEEKLRFAPPPLAPPRPPPTLATPPGSVSSAATKACPRCHTRVNAIDVTCFFCGYAFPEATRPPP